MMTASSLRTERRKRGWGQVEAAKHLGVSQPYLAMLERGKRQLTPELARKMVTAYGLPPEELPVPEPFDPAEEMEAQRLVEELAKLGYPGFGYVRTGVKRKNPGQVLLTALAQNSLEARVAEALPWLLLRYWHLNLSWLVVEAKKFDLQNRLGFVVSLARQFSEKTHQAERTQVLARLESLLDRSRLAREDYFYRPTRSDYERQWLLQNRPEAARHWNLLSDLRLEHLQYAD
jgi:transcriptional regulator with XRE-family HTH domain